jgi:hypothetical protein
MSSTPDPDAAVDARTRQPTRAATAITVVVTVALTAAVAVTLELTPALALAWVAALSLGGALYAAGPFPWTTLGRFFAGVLAVPLGLGALAGVAYTGLTLTGRLFPQPNIAESAVAMLAVAAQLGVVVGVTVAVVGAVATLGGLLDRDTLRSLSAVVYWAAVPPVVGAGALAVGSLVANARLGGIDRTVGSVTRRGSQQALDALVYPAPGSPSLASLAGLLFVAAVAANVTVRALPVEELLGPHRAAATDRVRNATAWTANVATLAILAGICTDFLVPPRVFREELGPSVYDGLATATAVPAVRAALLGLAAACLAMALAATAVKRLAAASTDAATRQVAPLASGGAVAASALFYHDRAVWRAQAFVVENLPPAFAGNYQRVAGSVIEFYGTLTLTLAALAVLFVVAAAAVLALRFGTWTRFLPTTATGPALTGGGLFVAAAFGGTQSLPPALFFAGVLGAFLAWDAGRFADTLGREIGRRAHTRHAETVHVATTLVVGLAAIALAVLTLTYATDITVIDPGSVRAAAAGVAGSLFLLVYAVR